MSLFFHRSTLEPEEPYFIHTPQLAEDTLCRRGPGRCSSKSGDPLVKCSVNTLYAKCEEGESEATCRPSFFDAFTGLPNRKLFFDRMTQIISTAKRDKTI